MKTKHYFKGILLTGLVTLLSLASCKNQESLTPVEARSIAKEAYIYANPMVDNYRAIHSYFVDSDNPDYKAPMNQIVHIPRVYTHQDRAVQTPNSDTPYSFLAMDLRTEPMVLTVPPIEAGRYFSIQLIDLYTHNFEYIGSRTTGNDGGHFLIAGPEWEGEIPDDIKKVIRAETELIIAIYRTQLFNPEDLENVKRIQAGYTVKPLSAFLESSAPEEAPKIEFIEPLSRDEIRNSPEVFQQLNFILQFCPTHPSEKDLMDKFAKIGVGAGREFDWEGFEPDIQKAIVQGIQDSWAEFEELKIQIEAGEVGSGDVFGTREKLQNNYLYRMAGAVLGIWGNSAEEAIYPSYYTDSENRPLDGNNKYTLQFAPGQLPPVHAFWSLTMYELPESLLVENPLDRYLLNSGMEEDFVRDKDGGVTLYFQHESPGKDKEPNWLPAPEGPFSVVMRLYWPKKEALDCRWQPPKINRVESK